MKPVKIALIMLLVFGFGCLIDREKTQYIAIRNGGEIKPVAKIVYKVSVERQEVIYWIEATDDTRSQLHKLKHCIVADFDNWEGDTIDFPYTRIEVIGGKFKSLGGKYINVSWWVWHFKTDPKPSNLALAAGSVMVIFFILAIILSIKETINKRREKGKRKVSSFSE